MDEFAETEMRNYATAAGFLLIAFVMMLSVFGKLTGNIDLLMLSCSQIMGFGLLLIGVILAICKKRDLSAITFLMIGMFQIFLSKIGLADGGNYLYLIVGIILGILAGIILTAKDKKKYLLAIMPALWGIGGIIYAVADYSLVLIVFDAIVAVIALYFALAVASERIKFPLGTTLKADVATDFKASGSVLGYLMFGINAAVWSLYYVLGEAVFTMDTTLTVLDEVCGFMIVFAGVLLFAIGKMRFTSIMFIILGCMIYAGSILESEMCVPIGIILIVLGLLAVLRTESRILPGLMLIIYGFSYILPAFIGEIKSPAFLLINLISGLIAVYLAFAVFSQSKKLKVF